MSGNIPHVVCLTMLVETSPQALPLGAACIASAIKHDVRTGGLLSVDVLCFSAEDREVAAALRAGTAGELVAGRLLEQGQEPQAVCFSVYVWNRLALEQAARRIKALRPEVICIAGGPEVTANPEGCSAFDYVVAGAGEGAVPQLLAALLLERGNARRDEYSGYALGIQGVYRPNGRSRMGCAVVRAVPPPLADMPSPYLDGTLSVAGYGGALWELARGCPFRCAYCYESKGEKQVRYLPMERLQKELELFAQMKVPQVFVLDPTYNADKGRAMELLAMIRRKAPDTFFYFEVRAELIDRPLARAFADILCSLQIGLQSAHLDVLKKVHRTLDRKAFVRNVGYLNEAGAVFGFDLIYGLPGDSYAGFMESIDFAISLYPNNLELFCLSVLPGTILDEQGAELGLLWQQEPPYHVLSGKTFPAEDMERAAELACAVHIFYTEGRAVPWCNALLHVLHTRPSAFLFTFARWLRGRAARLDKPVAMDVFTIEEIESFQQEFVAEQCRASHLERLLPVVRDMIALHGAVGRCTADGTESVVRLHYHPDDLFGAGAGDWIFFVKNIRPYKNTTRVFVGKGGVNWRVCKKC